MRGGGGGEGSVAILAQAVICTGWPPGAAADRASKWPERPGRPSPRAPSLCDGGQGLRQLIVSPCARPLRRALHRPREGITAPLGESCCRGVRTFISARTRGLCALSCITMAVCVNQPTNSDLYLLMQTVLQRVEGVSAQFAVQLEDVRKEIREARAIVDSTIGEVMLLRDRATALENASSGSWSPASCAKRARSSPPESSTTASPSRSSASADAVPGTCDKCKVHVTTHQAALVPKDAIANVVKARAAHANLGSDDYVLFGGNIGARFTLRFSRAEHASQFLAALRWG